MKRPSDASLYVAIALPIAILFAFLTPPFQVPDEVGHYWRANAIAHGELTSTKVDGRPGALIPTDARDLVATLWMELAGKDLKFDRAKFQNARQLRPSREEVRVSFPAFYTAVSYAPQATALFVCRAIGLRPLYAFYVGRVLNAAVGVLLIMLAMRLLPQAAWIFGSIGLTPMVLFLAGSFSADAVTTGLAFCTTAAALRPIKAAFPILAGFLSLAKPGYALIALLCAPRLRERRERLWIALAFVLVALGGWWAAAIARDAYYPPRPDLVTDARAQSAHVLREPLRFVQVAVTDYAQHATQYLDHLVGRLGWLDVGLPRIVLVSYVILFLYVALSVSLRLGAMERTTIAIVLAVTLLVISLSQYLTWSPIGGSVIEGLQGRHLIPIAPLALLMISMSWLRWSRWAIVVVTISGNAIALYMVAMRYYGRS
jgi:uncharacterized membrane protein